MKLNQILGNTQQLRFENIGYLKGKTKKWGLVIATIFSLMVIVEWTVLMSDFNFIMALIGLVFGVFFGYWGGKAYGWGWYWFKLKGGNFGEAMGKTLDDTIFYSFVFGSHSILITLVMLGLFVGIGFYIGLYCLIRYELIEYRKLKKQLA